MSLNSKSLHAEYDAALGVLTIEKLMVPILSALVFELRLSHGKPTTSLKSDGAFAQE